MIIDRLEDINLCLCDFLFKHCFNDMSSFKNVDVTRGDMMVFSFVLCS